LRISCKMMLVAALSAVALVYSGCDHDRKPLQEDPLKAKAREKYLEARRLFLTCDPNNYEKALGLYEEAMAFREDYPEALAGWAETVSMWFGYQITEDLYQTAYMKAQRAIRLDPDLDMGYRAMADLWRHQKDPETGKLVTEEALDLIEKAIERNPLSAENLYVKASILMNNDPEHALEVFRRAKAVNPNLGKIYFNMAATYQQMGDSKIAAAFSSKEEQEREKLEKQAAQYYDKSIELLKTYNELVPRDAAGYCSRAIAHMRKGEPEAAKELFQTTVSRAKSGDPSQIKWTILSYVHLAQIAEGENDLENARDILEKGLRYAPQNMDLISGLTRLSELMGDQEAADRYRKRAKDILESLEARDEKLSGPGSGTGEGSTAAP